MDNLHFFFLQMAVINSLSLCSYNMFGYRNGFSMLNELCNKYLIVAIQEFWLREDELDKLDLIHCDYTYYAASGMNSAVAQDILKGRPFGGVGFLWHKSLNGIIEPIGYSADGRCIIIKASLCNYNFIFINVYFPCFENSAMYKNDIGMLTAFIEGTLNGQCFDEVIIMGDTNFDISPGHSGFNILDSLLRSINMSPCDDLVSGSTVTNTYVNEALNAASRIDHFFVTNGLKPCITYASVIDCAAVNNSDHRPIDLHINLLLLPHRNVRHNAAPSTTKGAAKPMQCKLRWDKGRLVEYYSVTREVLANTPHDCYQLYGCSELCNSASHKASINQHYLHIVNALKLAESATIPRIPNSALKPFWNDNLNDLKQKSIAWHNIWLNAGRPQSGIIHQIKSSCKLKYKLAIKNAVMDYENRFDDDILCHFMNKDIPDFWKSWSSKMHSNIAKDVYIDGSNNDSHVANAFAGYFESVYYNSSNVQSAKNEFESKLAQMSHVDKQSISSYFTVELIDSCIRKLKAGKAAGPDELMTEHLLNAHPAVVIHLCLLFRNMSVHGFVPHDFGVGIIVPLLKDKLGNVNDTNNYRGITLIPVISKLFELVLLEIAASYLSTDDLQFGFKKGTGCNNAIFLLQETVDYFTSRGSSVFAACLDIKKAFDRVNHFKMFTSLIKSGAPKWLILILVNWYSKLNVCVKWKNCISRSFAVASGVRQGGVISPALFNVFINSFIINLRNCNDGCRINGHFVGAIMYADDLIILSATVHGLQRMLSCCESTSIELLLDFNCKKSNCTVIGPASKVCISEMALCDEALTWSNNFKYLGVNFIGGKSLSVDINIIKRKFYVSCNCILGNTKTMNDIIKLSLMESYCLPILMYATVSVKLTNVQLSVLNACWNSVYRRIFGFNKWESVRGFINGIGRLDFRHLRLFYCIKFYDNSMDHTDRSFTYVLRLFRLSETFGNICKEAGLYEVERSRLASFPVRRIKEAVHTTFSLSC